MYYPEEKSSKNTCSVMKSNIAVIWEPMHRLASRIWLHSARHLIIQFYDCVCCIFSEKIKSAARDLTTYLASVWTFTRTCLTYSMITAGLRRVDSNFSASKIFSQKWKEVYLALISPAIRRQPTASLQVSHSPSLIHLRAHCSNNRDWCTVYPHPSRFSERWCDFRRT